MWRSLPSCFPELRAADPFFRPTIMLSGLASELRMPDILKMTVHRSYDGQAMPRQS